MDRVEDKQHPVSGEGSAAGAGLQTVRQAIAGGATSSALSALAGLLRDAPDRGELHMLKGLALEREGRVDDSRAAFIRASELLQNSPEPLLYLARQAQQQSRPADELRHLRAAAARGAAKPALLSRMLQLELDARMFAAALDTANRLLLVQPGSVRGTVSAALALDELGRGDEAERLLSQALNTQAPDPEYMTTYFLIVGERQKRYRQAEERLEEVAERLPDSAAVWSCLGTVRSRLRRPSDAIAALLRAAELDPGDAQVWYNLGIIYRELGNTDAAADALAKCLDVQPTHPPALRIRGYDNVCQYGDKEFNQVMAAVALCGTLGKEAQVDIHYAGAKAFEDVGDLRTAFIHYERAGRIQRQLTPWNEARLSSTLASMRQHIGRSELQEARKEGAATQLPVFIVGQPRSGTTLVEQVIASHPEACAVGEVTYGAEIIAGMKVGQFEMSAVQFRSPDRLPPPAGLSLRQRGEAYISAIRAEAGNGACSRIVDKQPGNYHWIGLLDAIVPGSYFIHTRRHPVETCLSQYRLLFPGYLNYSYDLRDLGKHYRQYLDYMRYWTDLLAPDRILHVRYEDVVLHFEREARRIIEFIGLPWDDSCLRFHEAERRVATASVTQVRRPLYNDSINRWRKYEPYLKPLLDELGPLVREYEEELQGERAPPYP